MGKVLFLLLPCLASSMAIIEPLSPDLSFFFFSAAVPQTLFNTNDSQYKLCFSSFEPKLLQGAWCVFTALGREGQRSWTGKLMKGEGGRNVAMREGQQPSHNITQRVQFHRKSSRSVLAELLRSPRLQHVLLPAREPLRVGVRAASTLPPPPPSTPTPTPTWNRLISNCT